MARRENITQHNWASLEFQQTDFGDRRLSSRLIKIADRMSECPESPINQACHRWSESKAAYRFFQNDRISELEILSSHVEKTTKRARKFDTILAIQDTSFFSYDSHKKTTGLGIIGDDPIRHGLTMHTSFAVTTEGLPLGILDQKIISEKRPEKKMAQKDRRSTSIEKKKNFRWLESLQNTNFAMSEQNTHVVTVCDREADFYEFFKMAHDEGAPLLVRAKSDRKINKTSRHSENSGEYLWEHIGSSTCRGKIQIEVPSGHGRQKRTAILEIRFGSFVMHPSGSLTSIKSDEALPLKLHAVQAIEPHPPKGEDRLEWMLLTDLPLNSFDEAVKKVQWYSLRWKIEVFHKILKSGLNVERCRLNNAERLTRYLTVMSIIAWRIFWITFLARSNPLLPCTVILAENEWKVLYRKINRTESLPRRLPTVECVVRWIAQLGGFLGRRGDGNPGVITLWRGWKRLNDLSEGWNLANV
jgi:hypothetical protein